MDDVADLVFAPFRNIIEQGKTAIENAGTSHAEMLKAAQNLVKEGERALELLEPRCKKLYDESGSDFLSALRQCSELKDCRQKLSTLLYDFDEYTEVDDFDASKFTELRKLSKRTAPEIQEILLTIKIEKTTHLNHFLSQLSPPSSPHPDPSLLSPTAQSHTSYTSSMPRESLSSMNSDPNICSVADATEQLDLIASRTVESRCSTIDEYYQQPPSDPPSSSFTPAPLAPMPPTINPWDRRQPPMIDYDKWSPDMNIVRRPMVQPPPPVEHRPNNSPPMTSPRQQSQFSEMRPQNVPENRDYFVMSTNNHVTTSSSNSSNNNVDEDPYPYNDHRVSTYSAASSNQSTRPMGLSNINHSIPEEKIVDTESRPEPFLNPYSPMLDRSGRPRQVSQSGFSEEGYYTTRESMFSDRLSDHLQQVDRKPSIAESLIDPNGFPVSIASLRRQSYNSATETNTAVPVRNHMPVPPRDSDGLIPVESVQSNPPLQLSQRDCTIDNSSSFCLQKCFCEGAQEVLRGGIGVKKTKKPVGVASSATVARCTSCLFELDFKQLEFDINKMDEGNYSKNGVGYRLRFLQKSHLHTKRVDDVMYGCVFCIHLGRTVDPSDATVFTTTAALFSHLSRHPRPLPEVPGIAIVEEADIPPELRNNYDIHFRNPPEIHPVLEREDEIGILPSGVARQQARRLFGHKLPFDRAAALELMQGAKITGLTWPEKYNGEWCQGWHDGAFAAMPMENLRLDRPANLQKGSVSRIRAKARFKFVPKDKDKDDWLKFDKDELITNISWPYPEHWCWSGMNSKGKWGIFPQAFIDTNTVQELSQSAATKASVLNSEKNKSTSILPRFSLRSRSGRPPSVSESTSSDGSSIRTSFPIPASRYGLGARGDGR